MRIQVDCAYSTIIGAVHQKKEDKKPSDSRCGSVETCRNTFTVLPGEGESIREDSVCLESENYGKFDPEEHQEDLPL